VCLGCSKNGWNGGEVSNDGYIEGGGLDIDDEGEVGSEEEV
jgi:hypothetical protein